MQYRKVIGHLRSAGLPVREIISPSGGRVAVTTPGGCLAGMCVEGVEENILYANEEIAAPGWLPGKASSQIGGLRLWFAPEYAYFWQGKPDARTLSNHKVQRNCDPGSYAITHVDGNSVRMIAQWMESRTHGQNKDLYVPKVLNRGIAGDTIRDLDRRWDEDVLALEPDVVSIKIGVNDVWSRFNPDCSDRAVPVDEFQKTYDRCLTRLRGQLPDAQTVLCEPCGIWPPAPATGNAELQPYLRAIHLLAEKHGVFALVELHRAFVDAMAREPEIDLMADGVHPTPPGDMLIAREWMKATGNLL